MDQENRSLSTLLGDLSSSIGVLFRKEIELAKAEASEHLTDAVVAIGAIAAGVAMVLAALIVLLQALVLGLTEAGIPPAWASLIVGILVAGAGYLCMNRGAAALKATKLAPRRTVEALEKDAKAVKEQVS